MASTSGAPTSYIPGLTSISGIVRVIDGKTGGSSNKFIIGVSIGIRLLVLLTIIAGCMYALLFTNLYISMVVY